VPGRSRRGLAFYGVIGNPISHSLSPLLHKHSVSRAQVRRCFRAVFGCEGLGEFPAFLLSLLVLPDLL